MKEPRPKAVRLAPTAFVAPGAVVVGEVTIGHRASVWFNTVVRGDVDTIELGEASNLQDNSTVHVDEGNPVRIGARVTVGHRTIVHGCVIEDDCLIGMGSVLLSGCRIGAGSYVGAASLVLEGMQIPPGSVAFGSPARVIGQVGERHREGIRHGTETYAELAAACLHRGMARHVARDGEIVGELVPMSSLEWDARVDAAHQLLGTLEERRIQGKTDERFWRAVERLTELDLARHSCLKQLHADGEASWEAPLPGPPDPTWRVPEGVVRWMTRRRLLVMDYCALGAKGERLIVRHATRGPFLLSELIREWAEEDRELLSSLTAPTEKEA